MPFKDSDQLARLSEAYEYIGAPILIIDGNEGKILVANSATEAMTGYSVEEMKELAFSDLFVSEDLRVDAIEYFMKSSSASSEINEHDLQLRKKSGRSIPVSLNLRSTVGETRRLSICTFTDLSALRELEEEREDIQRKVLFAGKLADIGRLASGVAHEINNPLMIVQGHVECLSLASAKGTLDSSTLNSSLQPILDSVKRMARIIRQMTRLSQASNQLSEVSLNQVVDIAVSAMESRLRNNQIELTVRTTEADRVNGDEKQLVQIVVNILSNAIHALNRMETGRKIEIEVTCGATETKSLRISNNGPRINNDMKDKLMTPFYTTRDVGSGIGLGLYVSQGIMQAHGGNLICDDVEQGCSFTLRFPAAQSLQEVEVKGPPAALVIDDEAGIRNMLSQRLYQMGVTAYKARNGIEALRILQQKRKINLIVTDIRMPEMDGIELIRNVNFIFPAMKVIVTSGYVDAHRLEVSGLNVDGLFEKPIDMGRFEATVQKILSLSENTLKAG